MNIKEAGKGKIKNNVFLTTQFTLNPKKDPTSEPPPQSHQKRQINLETGT